MRIFGIGHPGLFVFGIHPVFDIVFKQQIDSKALSTKNFITRTHSLNLSYEIKQKWNMEP